MSRKWILFQKQRHQYIPTFDEQMTLILHEMTEYQKNKKERLKQRKNNELKNFYNSVSPFRKQYSLSEDEKQCRKILDNSIINSGTNLVQNQAIQEKRRLPRQYLSPDSRGSWSQKCGTLQTSTSSLIKQDSDYKRNVSPEQLSPALEVSDILNRNGEKIIFMKPKKQFQANYRNIFQKNEMTSPDGTKLIIMVPEHRYFSIGQVDQEKLEVVFAEKNGQEMIVLKPKPGHENEYTDGVVEEVITLSNRTKIIVIKPELVTSAVQEIEELLSYRKSQEYYNDQNRIDEVEEEGSNDEIICNYDKTESNIQSEIDQQVQELNPSRNFLKQQQDEQIKVIPQIIKDNKNESYQEKKEIKANEQKSHDKYQQNYETENIFNNNEDLKLNEIVQQQIKNQNTLVQYNQPECKYFDFFQSEQKQGEFPPQKEDNYNQLPIIIQQQNDLQKLIIDSESKQQQNPDQQEQIKQIQEMQIEQPPDNTQVNSVNQSPERQFIQIYEKLSINNDSNLVQYSQINPNQKEEKQFIFKESIYSTQIQSKIDKKDIEFIQQSNQYDIAVNLNNMLRNNVDQGSKSVTISPRQYGKTSQPLQDEKLNNSQGTQRNDQYSEESSTLNSKKLSISPEKKQLNEIYNSVDHEKYSLSKQKSLSISPKHLPQILSQQYENLLSKQQISNCENNEINKLDDQNVSVINQNLTPISLDRKSQVQFSSQEEKKNSTQSQSNNKLEDFQYSVTQHKSVSISPGKKPEIIVQSFEEYKQTNNMNIKTPDREKIEKDTEQKQLPIQEQSQRKEKQVSVDKRSQQQKTIETENNENTSIQLQQRKSSQKKKSQQVGSNQDSRSEQFIENGMMEDEGFMGNQSENDQVLYGNQVENEQEEEDEIQKKTYNIIKQKRKVNTLDPFLTQPQTQDQTLTLPIPSLTPIKQDEKILSSEGTAQKEQRNLKLQQSNSCDKQITQDAKSTQKATRGKSLTQDQVTESLAKKEKVVQPKARKEKLHESINKILDFNTFRRESTQYATMISETDGIIPKNQKKKNLDSIKQFLNSILRITGTKIRLHQQDAFFLIKNKLQKFRAIQKIDQLSSKAYKTLTINLFQDGFKQIQEISKQQSPSPKQFIDDFSEKITIRRSSEKSDLSESDKQLLKSLEKQEPLTTQENLKINSEQSIKAFSQHQMEKKNTPLLISQSVKKISSLSIIKKAADESTKKGPSLALLKKDEKSNDKKQQNKVFKTVSKTVSQNNRSDMLQETPVQIPLNNTDFEESERAEPKELQESPRINMTKNASENQITQFDFTQKTINKSSDKSNNKSLPPVNQPRQQLQKSQSINQQKQTQENIKKKQLSQKPSPAPQQQSSYKSMVQKNIEKFSQISQSKSIISQHNPSSSENQQNLSRNESYSQRFQNKLDRSSFIKSPMNESLVSQRNSKLLSNISTSQVNEQILQSLLDWQFNIIQEEDQVKVQKQKIAQSFQKISGGIQRNQYQPKK